jgi:hypothetical protein
MRRHRALTTSLLSSFIVGGVIANGHGHHRNSSRRKRRKLATGLALLPPKVVADCVEVTSKFVRMFLAKPTNFFDDWIIPHDYDSKSSSGVQMIGGS